MSGQSNHRANNQNSVDVNVQQPFVVVTTSSQEGKEPLPSSPTANEAEALLDIEGLLKIVNLIRIIKESGRLKPVEKKNVETNRAVI